MDLRSLIDKLDNIEQSKLLLESEELLEKVGLRLDDYTNAVRGIANADERAAKIGEFARQYNYAGLFDPITGKFVNADGKFAFFGGYESEVRQLAAKGLIPDAAKTTAVLGMMGQDEKVARPTSQSAEALYKQIDKSDELIKKALEVPTSEGIAESLLKEFGINTNILEAVTPEEHQLIKKTRKDIEPLLKSGDGDAVEYKGNYENYIRERDRLIARIKEIIATIKKPAAPAAAAPAAAATNRSGSSATANESLKNNSELLVELSLTPQGQKAGAKLFEPDWKGYLSPEQVKANLALLKKGHAKLDWSDHVGKSVKDWANMATFDLADKAAAYASSVGDKNTSYEKERAKQKAVDQAYNQDPNALNLRTAANAVGYKIDANNSIGNMTVGDVLGLVGPGAVSTVFNTGRKVAAKLGGNAVAKFAAGTAAVIGTQKAADAIDKVVEPTEVTPTKVEPQPANLKFDPEVQKLQQYLISVYGPTAVGVHKDDGKLGKDTLAAIERAKKEGKLSPDGKVPEINTANADTRLPNGANGAHADASANTNSADTRLPNGANGAHADAATNASAALDPKLVQDELKKLGVTGNQITPEQLLALADSLGIKDEQVADAGSNASNATADTISGPDMSGGTPKTSTTLAGGDGGLVQGTTATAESTELSRILALSGLSEDSELGEGSFDRVAGWVIDELIAKGMSREANLAKQIPKAGMTVAQREEIRAAKALAARIAAKGEKGVASAEKGVASAEKGVASAEKGVASAEKVAPKVADDAVAKLTADAAKGEGLLYNVGKLGGRFVRLIKNNKFLALLAALAAIGIGLYIANKIKDPDDPNGPVGPVVPVDGKCPAGYKLSKDGKTCEKDTGPVNPHPVVDPNEEENKRKLADLEKLLAQLYGGWPTDPETTETIKAAVAAGAKAPAGFKEGGVQTQPAGSSSSGSDRVFGGRGHAMSAQDLAAASGK